MSDSPETPAASFDPFAPATIENPFPFFRALRRDAPLYELPNRAYWLVSRFEDCRQIVLDTDTFSSRLVGVMVGEEGRAPRLLPLMDGVATNVLAIADPPDHTRQRKLITHAFSARRVTELESAVIDLVDELLDPILGAATSRNQPIDAMRDFAVPLPMTVICRLLGLPLDDRRSLQNLADDAVALIDGINSPQQIERYAHSAAKLGSYLLDRFREACADPAENVLGTLAAAHRAGSLSEDEAAAILVQLATAGQETTGGLIGSAIMLLAGDDTVQRQVRDEPHRITALVEETLRLESPFLGHFRQATKATRIAGQPVAAGTKLMVLWGSANRDETIFERADEIDLQRPNPKNHFGFGHGAHFCIGAELARMEARVALRRLLERTTWIHRQATPHHHVPSLFVRRLVDLPLRIDAV